MTFRGSCAILIVTEEKPIHYINTPNQTKNELIRSLYHDGLTNDNVIRLLEKPLNNEDYDTFRMRIESLVAPNIVASVINSHIAVASSRFVLSPAIPEKLFRGLVTELLLEGSTYLYNGTEIISTPIIMKLAEDNTPRLTQLWEADKLKYFTIGAGEFLQESVSPFEKHRHVLRAYYNLKSTHCLSLMYSSFPMFSRKGVSSEEFGVSPSKVFEFIGEGSVDWITHDGRLLEVSAKLINELLTEIYMDFGYQPPIEQQIARSAVGELVKSGNTNTTPRQLAQTIADVLNLSLTDRADTMIQDVSEFTKSI